MRKRILAVLIALMQIVQVVPVYAAKPDTTQLKYLHAFAILANNGNKTTDSTLMGSAGDIDTTVDNLSKMSKDDFLNTDKVGDMESGTIALGMMMAYEPWADSSKLASSIGGQGILDVLGEQLKGTKDIKPSKVDTKEVNKEFTSGTSNTSMDDYASTVYARISVLLQLVSGESPDHASDLNKYNTNRKSVDWKTDNFVILDGIPIMLDSSVTEWKVTESKNFRMAELNATVAEFGAYATKWREAHSGSSKLSDDEKACLESMSKAVESYRDLIPALQIAWEYGQPSLKDLYNEKEEQEEEVSDNSVVDDSSVESAEANLIDHPQPLIDFFQINTLGKNTPGLNDPWNWFSSEAENVSMTSTVSQDSATVSQGSALAVATNAASDAISTGIVLTDYLKTGISESASYVPMMTNVYHRDVLNDIDDTDFKTNFHYKYGFMRKALLIEKSSTSVQNFYTTKGKTHGQLKVCTLQDLLNYADNNSEVTLWLDDNFYNAETLRTLLQEIDSEQKDRIEKSTAYGTTAFHATYGGINLQNIITPGDVSDEANQIEAANGTQNATKEESLDQFLSYSGLTNIDTSNKDSFLKVINALANAAGSTIQDTDEVLKTKDFSSYSASTREKLTQLEDSLLVGGDYTDADSPTYEINNFDDYLMSSYYIKKTLSGMTTREENSNTDATIGYRYTTYNPYTPLLSYAWVSAIYRDSSAFSLYQNCSAYSPVFMASDKLDTKQLNDPNVPKSLMNTIFNYALLKNLSSMIQISYQHTLDLKSPLYMDIYGNILTASGTVVIPAASNATLWSSDWADVQPGIGLYTCYGKGWVIPDTNENPMLASKWSNIENPYWMPLGREVSSTLTSGVIEYSNLDTYDKEAQEVAKVNMYSYVQNDARINWWAYAGIISEVMRGAPVESIDVINEGLVDSNADIDGMVLASKLESLENSLQNSMKQNSLFIMPDFSRMDNIEFFMTFLVKILAILTVFVVLVIIYQDGAANEIGLRTIFKTMFAVFLTFLSVTLVPAVFQFTYYGANRLLLQKEADHIIMFRTEKYNAGVEVGVTDTSVPTNNNDIMIRLDYLNVPWYDYISQVIFGSSITTIADVKLKRLSDSLVAHRPDVVVYNDGVYMSVTDILNSVRMDYTFGEDVFVANTEGFGDTENIGDGYDKNIYLQNTTDSQTFSYYSPYYAFLKVITTNINDYNRMTGQYSYVTKYMSGMRPKTVGLCENYFTSKMFMEDNVDIFRLHEIYENTPPEYMETVNGKLILKSNITPFDDTVFSTSDIETIKKSLWYSYDDDVTLDSRLRAMDKWARDYIANNQHVMSKISDETFIKVFCLSAALKYNQLYGISEANVYDIYNINSDDLLRLAVANTDLAMQASPMSYARYLFTYGGSAAVYAGAMLSMVLWFGSIFKPLCTAVVFLSVFLSLFVNKIVLRRKGGYMGYVVTVALISMINVLHAIILKACCAIPSFGFPTFVCTLLIMITQIIYLAALAMITWICMREWRDMGEEHYRAQAQKVRWQKHGNGAQALQTNVPYHKDNKEYYNDLVRAYRKRSGSQQNETDDFT